MMSAYRLLWKGHYDVDSMGWFLSGWYTAEELTRMLRPWPTVQ
jgi:hypothetical protein